MFLIYEKSAKSSLPKNQLVIRVSSSIDTTFRNYFKIKLYVQKKDEQHLFYNVTKGQLISKCPYEKSVSSKIPTKIFLGFLPWKFTTSRLVQNRVYLLANRT